MATNNLSGRIKRLERSAQLMRATVAGSQLVVRLRRFFNPDGTSTGVRVNGEFISREADETIAETERRAIDRLSIRSDSVASYQQIVRLNMTPVEELPD